MILMGRILKGYYANIGPERVPDPAARLLFSPLNPPTWDLTVITNWGRNSGTKAIHPTRFFLLPTSLNCNI